MNAAREPRKDFHITLADEQIILPGTVEAKVWEDNGIFVLRSPQANCSPRAVTFKRERSSFHIASPLRRSLWRHEFPAVEENELLDAEPTLFHSLSQEDDDLIWKSEFKSAKMMESRSKSAVIARKRLRKSTFLKLIPS
mmetsp:Transcript_2245/g.6704  ORF Transcript_2245/g.6704 Transcript_2245/m.6704 type:complete len:139 (-) Transcript_2245:426-842(-)